MKKIKRIAVILLLVFLCGCGSDSAKETVSMYDLCATMEAADSSLPEMLYVSSENDTADKLLGHVSDMDYDKVDCFFVSYSKEAKADEIVVIAVKDKADVNEAKQSLEEHRQSRIQLLDQYEPEEVRSLEDGLIFTKDEYAVLIICEDPDSVRKAFEDAVE